MESNYEQLKNKYLNLKEIIEKTPLIEGEKHE